ncbi:hypothetical protein HWV62_3821 [Athelia sp. TMB]|nr:hypothetical protein HWV62_3821 [Athelia sp. TMB]
MLSPYPLKLRPRSQSNPARPKFHRSQSSPDATSSSTEVDVVAKKQTAPKKPPRTAPRRGSLFSSSSTNLVPPLPTPPSPAIPTTPLPNPAPLVPTEELSPTISSRHASESQIPPKPHRPPRNPARKSMEPPTVYPFPLPMPSPFLPPGPAPRRGREAKATWDVDPTVLTEEGDDGIGKLLRRHKSISHTKSTTSTGGSLFSKSGRMERRERGKEHEKVSVLTSPKGKEKGKAKEKEEKSPSSPGYSFTHTLNSYYASLSITPRHSSVSLKKAPQPHIISHKRIETSPSGPPRRDSHSIPYIQSHSSESISASSSSHSRNKGKGKEIGHTQTSGPNLSTLDRTILQELKLSLSARDSQFVLKGPSPSCSSPFGLGLGGGTRHHPYPPSEVPYPRSYARSIVDLDVWETKWCEQLCGSLTWHVFPPDAPPKKVLDIGCGTGTWIMECTKLWKDAQFVGLDIVPLQPDLKRVGSRDVAGRVHWVQANFLEGLPFPNDEFDFVHAKRIARGVPEDKWDALFEEISRVMKPGGAFEMFEEELYFPGALRDVDGDGLTDSGTDGQPSYLSRSRTPSSERPDFSEYRVRARSSSPATPRTSNRRNTEPPVPNWTLTSPSPAPKRHDAAPRSVFAPSSPRAPSLSISTMLESAGPESHPEHKLASPPMRQSLSTGSATESTGPSYYRGSFSPSSQATSPATSQPASPAKSSFAASPLSPLVRIVPIAPPNPHDHSVLEAIYTEMHAERFINLAPLSLLANTLSLWFKDLRTHPPLILTFPPPPVHPRRRSPEPKAAAYDDETGLWEDDSDPVMESELPRHSTDNSGVVEQAEANKPEVGHYVTSIGLLLGASPYVYLDDGQFAAFSPSTKASFPSATAIQGTPSSPTTALPWTMMDNELADVDPDAVIKTLENISSAQTPASEQASSQVQQLAAALANFKMRLPNPQLHMDLRTLNLHLALRVAEILAMAEAMWEWVVTYQAEFRKRPKNNTRTILGAHLKEPVKTAIAELSRADFDGLIAQFDMDMRDRYSLGSVLEDRFAWNVISMPSHQDRKAFDTACEKWEKYQHQKSGHVAEAQPVIRQGRRHSHGQVLVESPSAFTHLPTIPDTISVRSDGSRPTMDFEETGASASSGQLGRSDSHRSTHHGTTRTARRGISKSRSQISLPLEYAGGNGPGDGLPHPSNMLSRTLRVFAAWKA